jgi:hypothetical protein
MAQPIGIILQQWADLGIFFYVLPALLIFALVFAILQKVRIMGGDANENKGVNAIIAIAVAMLALQFDQVPIFFQIFFPKVGIGLSIILAAMIFLGLFVDFHKSQGMAKLLLTVGGVVGIIILLTTLSEYSWWTGSFWQQNISAIVAGIVILIFVLVVVNSGSSSDDGGSLFRAIPQGVRE